MSVNTITIVHLIAAWTLGNPIGCEAAGAVFGAAAGKPPVPARSDFTVLPIAAS